MSTEEISDADLAALDRSLERQHRDGTLYNESYGSEEVRALRARLRRAEADNQCDACLGTGAPLSGGPCMCGGTGKMSEAAKWLRDSWLNDPRLLPKGPDHCGYGDALRLGKPCPVCNDTRMIREDRVVPGVCRCGECR